MAYNFHLVADTQQNLKVIGLKTSENNELFIKSFGKNSLNCVSASSEEQHIIPFDLIEEDSFDQLHKFEIPKLKEADVESYMCLNYSCSLLQQSLSAIRGLTEPPALFIDKLNFMYFTLAPEGVHAYLRAKHSFKMKKARDLKLQMSEGNSLHEYVEFLKSAQNKVVGLFHIPRCLMKSGCTTYAEPRRFGFDFNPEVAASVETVGYQTIYPLSVSIDEAVLLNALELASKEGRELLDILIWNIDRILFDKVEKGGHDMEVPSSIFDTSKEWLKKSCTDDIALRELSTAITKFSFLRNTETADDVDFASLVEIAIYTARKQGEQIFTVADGNHRIQLYKADDIAPIPSIIYRNLSQDEAHVISSRSLFKDDPYDFYFELFNGGYKRILQNIGGVCFGHVDNFSLGQRRGLSLKYAFQSSGNGLFKYKTTKDLNDAYPGGEYKPDLVRQTHTVLKNLVAKSGEDLNPACIGWFWLAYNEPVVGLEILKYGTSCYRCETVPLSVNTLFKNSTRNSKCPWDVAWVARTFYHLSKFVIDRKEMYNKLTFSADASRVVLYSKLSTISALRLFILRKVDKDVLGEDVAKKLSNKKTLSESSTNKEWESLLKKMKSKEQAEQLTSVDKLIPKEEEKTSEEFESFLKIVELDAFDDRQTNDEVARARLPTCFACVDAINSLASAQEQQESTITRFDSEVGDDNSSTQSPNETIGAAVTEVVDVKGSKNRKQSSKKKRKRKRKFAQISDPASSEEKHKKEKTTEEQKKARAGRLALRNAAHVDHEEIKGLVLKDLPTTLGLLLENYGSGHLILKLFEVAEYLSHNVMLQVDIWTMHGDNIKTKLNDHESLWNDEIIEGVLTIIKYFKEGGIFIISSLSDITSKRVSKKFNDFKEVNSGKSIMILSPIHVEDNHVNHWILFFAMRNGSDGDLVITLFDSTHLGGPSSHMLTHERVIDLKNFLDEKLEGAVSDPKMFSMKGPQENSYDCGVWVCFYALHLVKKDGNIEYIRTAVKNQTSAKGFTDCTIFRTIFHRLIMLCFKTARCASILEGKKVESSLALNFNTLDGIGIERSDFYSTKIKANEINILTVRNVVRGVWSVKATNDGSLFLLEGDTYKTSADEAKSPGRLAKRIRKGIHGEAFVKFDNNGVEDEEQIDNNHNILSMVQAAAPSYSLRSLSRRASNQSSSKESFEQMLDRILTEEQKKQVKEKFPEKF